MLVIKTVAGICVTYRLPSFLSNIHDTLPILKVSSLLLILNKNFHSFYQLFVRMYYTRIICFSSYLLVHPSLPSESAISIRIINEAVHNLQVL